MSFISVVANQKFISVVSDGRVTNVQDESIKEDYKKFKEISEKQFIAFAGAKEFCEMIVEQFDYDEKPYNLFDIASQIHSTIHLEPYKFFRIIIVVGGLDLDDKIAIYSIENTIHQQIRMQKPAGDQISYAFLNSDFVGSNIDTESKLIECFRIAGFETPERCLGAQGLLNSFISSVDNTVNNNTFSLTIEK